MTIVFLIQINTKDNHEWKVVLFNRSSTRGVELHGMHALQDW